MNDLIQPVQAPRLSTKHTYFVQVYVDDPAFSCDCKCIHIQTSTYIHLHHTLQYMYCNVCHLRHLSLSEQRKVKGLMDAHTWRCTDGVVVPRFSGGEHHKWFNSDDASTCGSVFSAGKDHWCATYRSSEHLLSMGETWGGNMNMGEYVICCNMQ